jgi:type I restriction enzyme, S subunit
MESITKYKKYKPSEVLWIGDVPDHWKIKRLKDLVSQKITDGPHETPELVDDEDGVPFISAEAITENGINYDARGGNISAKQDMIYSQKCKPKKHDIFIVKSGSTTGRIGYVDTDKNFNIWSPLALVRSNNQTSSRFLFYFLSSDCIQGQIQTTWSFGTQPNIGMGVIERLRLSIPSPTEQKTIANYLDQQTQKIDRLIKNKINQVDKLRELRQVEINNAVTKGLNPNVELKKSSVDWLGKIPVHWKVKRLKNYTTKIGSGVTPKGGSEVYEETGVPLFRSQNIHFDGLRLDDIAFITKEVHDSMSGSKVEPNDVLLNITGASIGRCFYYDGAMGEANVNQHVCIIRTNTKLDFRFLQLYLSSDSGQSQVFMGQVGTSREGLTFQDIKNIIFAYPPIEEQIQIAEHLQQRTVTIDKLIRNIEDQIEKLQELRRITIYDAVTGKIKVNAYAEATA